MKDKKYITKLLNKEVLRLLNEAYLSEVIVIESVDSDFCHKPEETSRYFIDKILDVLDNGENIIGEPPSECDSDFFLEEGMEVPSKMYYDFLYIAFDDVVDEVYYKDNGKDKKNLADKLNEYFKFCNNCIEVLKEKKPYHTLRLDYPNIYLEVDEFLKGVHEDLESEGYDGRGFKIGGDDEVKL